jgi:uncharacterized protein (TIGR03435 family)
MLGNVPCVRVLLLAVSTALVGGTQTTPKFEVVSVKPNHEGSGSFSIETDAGTRFHTRNFTVWNLIRHAYKLTDLQIADAPEWTKSEGFDIDGRPAAQVSADEMLAMIRSLLAERFRLQMHPESRSIPAYSLQVGKTGPKLSPPGESATGSTLRMGDMTVKRMGMAGLVQILEFEVGRPVLDETGLAGDFSFQLKWTREKDRAVMEAAENDPARSSIFTALQEQLGLRLTTKKKPVEIYVVDHVERPAEN